MGELTQIQTASLTLGYAYHPNGRLLSESINSSETITYQYDDWNRLSTASSSTGTWGNRYVYDGFNNLTNKIVTAGSAPSLSVSINSATNRITGQSYDANVNVTVHPETAQSIAYDFENRVTNSNAQYDRQNRILTTDGVKYTFYGLSGEKLAIFNGTTRTRRYLYFAGRLIGTANQSEVNTPQTLDRLGSIRQSQTTQTMRFFPYGEPRETATTTVQQYATYETELSATSTYDAWNRTYSAQQGRFLSPDPYQASGGPADPGSWNRYSYVGNDPANLTDRQGLNRDICDDVDSPSDYCQFLRGGSGRWGLGISSYWNGEYLVNRFVSVWFPYPPPGGSVGGAGKITSKQAAKSSLKQSLEAIADECYKKLGITRSYAYSKSEDIQFFDGRPSEDGGSNIQQILGPLIAVHPSATFHSISYARNAVTLRTTGQTISRYVVLGANFFSKEYLADQRITLAHEAFHYITQRRDVALAKPAGYDGTDEYEASARFTDWLKEGCK